MAGPRKDEAHVHPLNFHDFIQAHNQPDPLHKNPPLCLHGRLVSHNHKRYLNGYKKNKGASLQTVDEILVTYGFTLTEFELWCEERDLDPYV